DGGSGPLLVCPACGSRRDRGSRFCPSCGLDFWRAAAGEPFKPVAPTKPARSFRLPFRRAKPRIQPEPAEPAATGGTAGAAAPVASERAGTPRDVGPPRDAGIPQIRPAAAPPARPAGAAAGGTVRAARKRPGTARGIAVLGELVEGVPRAVLLPAGGIGVLAVVAFVSLVLFRPSSPTAVHQTAPPPPPPPSHNLVLNAFFREVRDPHASYAVTVKGTVAVEAGGKKTTATVDGDFLVAGNDFSGTLHVEGAGVAPFDGSVIQIGQDGWARMSASGSWTHQALPAQAESANPFQWISTVDDVTYLAPGADVEGKRTHRLETTKWLSGSEYDALSLSLVGAQRDSRMEVETTDGGVPLTATYQFSMRGGLPAGGGSLALNGTADYTFSRWGTAITIDPPG
ncbi:MAG: hypothetical protein ACXWK9_13830, partial [Myxococcaceae bacterium]